MFFCEYCEIFKNIYFEKHPQTTASEDTPTMSGGEFGLNETSTECILFNQLQLYNIYVS